ARACGGFLVTSGRFTQGALDAKTSQVRLIGGSELRRWASELGIPISYFAARPTSVTASCTARPTPSRDAPAVREFPPARNGEDPERRAADQLADNPMTKLLLEVRRSDERKPLR